MIRHGTVVLETYSPGRGPVTIETLESGEVLGWSWLFSPYRWHLDARALTPVHATEFDATCLRTKCERDPAFGYELSHGLRNADRASAMDPAPTPGRVRKR